MMVPSRQQPQTQTKEETRQHQDTTAARRRENNLWWHGADGSRLDDSGGLGQATAKGRGKRERRG